MSQLPLPRHYCLGCERLTPDEQWHIPNGECIACSLEADAQNARVRQRSAEKVAARKAARRAGRQPEELEGGKRPPGRAQPTEHATLNVRCPVRSPSPIEP